MAFVSLLSVALTLILCLSITSVSYGSELTSIQMINNIPDKSVSADGRYIVFQSTVSSLVSGDTNNFSDIYIYDNLTDHVELISQGLSGQESNNDSLKPSISADGNYVVFQSEANNLIFNDINNKSDIFLYHCQTKQIELISVSCTGQQGNNNSYDAIIGFDGRYSSFSSDANNLVPDDTNNKASLFIFDHITKKIEMINETNIGRDESSQPGSEKSLNQLTGTWPNLSNPAYSSLNPFYKSGYGGQCTAFSWGRTREKLDISLASKFYGNAKTWWDGAIGIYNRGTTPRGNSIAVWGSGAYGHVAFVEQKSGDTVTFNEANWSKYINTKYGGGYDGAPKSLSTAQMANRGGYILLGYIYVGGEGEVPSPSNNIIYPGLAGFTNGGAYWWNASGYGINGTMKYTYCNGNTRDSWGKWSFNLAAVGGDAKYKVEAYIPNNHATTGNAHYHILHAGKTDYKSVNQNNISNAWVDLGTYDFTSAGTAAVELDDATGETYVNSGSPKIGFDAMRLTYVSPIDTQPPSGSWITPTDGQKVVTPGSINLSVNATDNTSVAKVIFHADYDGQWHELGTDAHEGNGTYSLTWNYNITPQNVLIHAHLYDASNNWKNIEGPTVNFSNPTQIVTGVSLDKNVTTINVGANVILTATIMPTNATNKEVIWDSSDPSVATVDSNGNVKGVSAGKSVITVTTVDGNNTSTCMVEVTNQEVKVTGVNLDKSEINIEAGANETLAATIAPIDATNKNVTWSSSNTDVATVDSNGNVKGVNAGKSVITVTTVEGNKTAPCIVEVSDNTLPTHHQNISLDKEWRISFSQPIGSNQSVLESNIFLWRIDPVTKTKVKVEIIPVIDPSNSKVVIVKHATLFVAGASHELSVNVGIKDVSGKSLAKASGLVFRTQAASIN